MKNKKKLIIATSIILGVLVLTLGLTYAVFTYNRTGENSQLVLGDIWMKYTENNQLTLSDAMPTNISNYMTYKVNPIMNEQEVINNELSRCVSFYYGAVFVPGNTTVDSFCQGTGRLIWNSYTIQEDLDDWSTGNDYFLEEGGQELLDSGVILANGDSYIVNPIMKSQSLNELTRCVNVYNSLEYEFDEGSTAESYCKGTGTINGVTLLGEITELSNDRKMSLLSNNIVIPIIENLPYFEFEVSGKNTYKKEDIWYDIVLTYGDNHDTRTTRIRDDLLKFTLVKVEEENETILFNNRNYEDLSNKRIWVETIKANTTSEVNNTYRLYMWIDESTIIGNVNQDYTMEEWEDVFASIKVVVNGDFKEKDIYTNFVTAVKNKYGTDESLVAINTDGNLYDRTGEIREYRYSGAEVNNYVYFDTNGDGVKTDDEIWRIIGVFKDTVKDDNGNIVLDSEGNPTYEEKVKLVRNSELNENEVPDTIIFDNFYIRYSRDNRVFWNNPYFDSWGAQYNDWSAAGLMYYLNAEGQYIDNAILYLNLLSKRAKELISPTTYHLGNVYEGVDTVKNAYIQERGDIECSSDLEDDSHDNNCNIWYGNKATWTGLVGLMYPSDYGYSASSLYWETDMQGWNSAEEDEIIASDTSWMHLSMPNSSGWFISPSSLNINYALQWKLDGELSYWGMVYYISEPARPVISLKSNAKIIDAKGTFEDPYVVALS